MFKDLGAYRLSQSGLSSWGSATFASWQGLPASCSASWDAHCTLMLLCNSEYLCTCLGKVIQNPSVIVKMLLPTRIFLVCVCFAWFVGRYNNSPTCEALGKVMRSQYIGTVSSCISMSVNCDTASAPLMLAHLCHGAFLNVSNENSELLLSLHCTVSLTCLC